ncbi:MAG TPA: polysaccharide biosynthesis C-terminal domain-containing protein, partial [Acidimicrobiales bacterium]|nr:polysaccharide biosynthesis C-terminal domain-containing protein [Acidimicrobiales bacterium]
FLNLAWLPRIFGITDPPTRAAVLAGSRDGLYRLLVPFTMGIALGGPLVLRIWAPRSFHTQTLIPVVALVVASTIPVCTAYVHSRLLLSEGRSSTVALITVTAAAVNVGLNLVLVPRIGINGSALATLAAYGLLAMGMASLSRLVLPLPRPPLWLAGSLATIEGFILLSSYLPNHGSAAILRALGTLVCVVACISVLRRLQTS